MAVDSRATAGSYIGMYILHLMFGQLFTAAQLPVLSRRLSKSILTCLELWQAVLVSKNFFHVFKNRPILAQRIASTGRHILESIAGSTNSEIMNGFQSQRQAST